MYLEAGLKSTWRKSYGFDGVKGADVTKESGSVENATKGKWISRLKVQFPADKGGHYYKMSNLAKNWLPS